MIDGETYDAPDRLDRFAALARVSERADQFGLVDEQFEPLAAVDGHDRHAVAVSVAKIGVAVDVDGLDRDRNRRLLGGRFDRLDGLLAELAGVAAIHGDRNRLGHRSGFAPRPFLPSGPSGRYEQLVDRRRATA
ncbi:hypothetical protein HSR122_0628 [Halapricum desulfuricans]|uniref:Uncharacterized protein n=1 Tax=Halapricum desulfuricans TaxID=2841257 RepID=A0A897N623_9EURY|nr:hypothetical protein HSR122_0628 [Halapricum desulfuricans]